MIKNAEPGEFVFLETVAVAHDNQIQKIKACTLVVRDQHNETEGYIKESDLNSLGRAHDMVWTEKQLARHEIQYMKANSIQQTYV